MALKTPTRRRRPSIVSAGDITPRGTGVKAPRVGPINRQGQFKAPAVPGGMHDAMPELMDLLAERDRILGQQRAAGQRSQALLTTELAAARRKDATEGVAAVRADKPAPEPKHEMAVDLEHAVVAHQRKLLAATRTAVEADILRLRDAHPEWSGLVRAAMHEKVAEIDGMREVLSATEREAREMAALLRWLGVATIGDPDPD